MAANVEGLELLCGASFRFTLPGACERVWPIVRETVVVNPKILSYFEGPEIDLWTDVEIEGCLSSRAECCRVAGWYVPASHAVAADAPFPHQLPAGHASHVSCPPKDWYSPTGHGVHPLAPAAATLPGGQSRGADERSRQ